MSRQVVVVFVHGIQAENINYSDPMQEALFNRRIPKAMQDDVIFHPVFWAGLVRPRQKKYLKDAQALAGIEDDTLRQFIVEGLGDAAAYQKTRIRQNSAYYLIQDRIGAALEQLDAPGREKSPLIFIGHSLGCHIISSFVWDMNKLKQKTDAQINAEPDPETRDLCRKLRDASPFRRLDTFAGFVTLGSNMPLFTFTFGPDWVYPITRGPVIGKKALRPAFPGAALDTEDRERSKWLNFYSKKDLLGYPLKPLNRAYRDEPLLHDIAVRSESFISAFSSLTAFMSAHTGYWNNQDVLRHTAKLIRTFVEQS